MRIYTDGSCTSAGDGGWAWVLEEDFSMDGDPAMARNGGAEGQTNQRMEMKAVLEALLSFPGDDLTIVSDSRYVVNCFNDGWWRKWVKNGWKNSAREDVANRDLWELLLASIKDRDVTFEWVKGHSGDPMNELADRLATEARVNHLSDRGS